MKNNMFMALATSLLNALAIVLAPLADSAGATQVLMAITGLLSPYISIWLLKVYIRTDDPAELTRKIADLKASIKICKADLADKMASDDFKAATRVRMERLQASLQTVRDDHGKATGYQITPISPPSSET